jgi:hypothetical protein
MALMENFILPTLKVCFYLGVFGSLTYFISKALVKRWLKTWKYTLKYKIFRKEMPVKTVEWCVDAIDLRNWTYFYAKQYLYLKGVTQQTVNETMYIFTKVEKQLIKGGGKNGKNISRNNCRSIKEELPKI